MQYLKMYIWESFLISLEKVHTNFQRNPSTAQIPAPKQILPSQKPGVGPAYQGSEKERGEWGDQTLFQEFFQRYQWCSEKSKSVFKSFLK